MSTFIHNSCLRPIGLAIKLNFKVSKVVYCIFGYSLSSLCILFENYVQIVGNDGTAL